MNHKEGFKQRTKVKIAEEKCSKYLVSKNILHKEFGFDPYNKPIPAKEFYLFPEFARSAPDFIIFSKDFYFLEVKGCKDYLRLKTHDMKCYKIWNKMMSLWFFIYSSIKKRHQIISYKKLNDITKHCKVEIFENDNKEHYKINLEDIYNE